MLDKYKDDRRGIGAESRKKEGRDRERRDERSGRERDRRDRDRRDDNSSRSERFRGGPRTPLFKVRSFNRFITAVERVYTGFANIGRN